MKKYFLGIFVVMMAVGLSAFTSTNESDSFTVVNWFRPTGEYVTTTQNLNPPAGECSSIGEGCLEGFMEVAENHEYPGGEPHQTYKE